MQKATPTSHRAIARRRRPIKALPRESHHGAVAIGLKDRDAAHLRLAALDLDALHERRDARIERAQDEAPARRVAIERHRERARERAEVPRERAAQAFHQDGDRGIVAQRKRTGLSGALEGHPLAIHHDTLRLRQEGTLLEPVGRREDELPGRFERPVEERQELLLLERGALGTVSREGIEERGDAPIGRLRDRCGETKAGQQPGAPLHVARLQKSWKLNQLCGASRA